MLTKDETKLLDRQISIYAQTFDRATFYQILANTFPSWRGQTLFDNDAYEEYLEDLVNDYINI